MKPQPTYLSGESIHEGDLVRIGSWEGVVEHLVTSEVAGWEDYWKDLGEGVMLAGPAFGSLFARFHDEDLVFVKRRNE